MKIASRLPPWRAASLGCSLLLLLTYHYLPRVRRTPGWLMPRASMCETVVSALFLVLWVYDRPHWLTHQQRSLAIILLCLAGFETAAHVRFYD